MSDQHAPDVQAQLREVEAEIDRIRGERDALSEQVGGQGFGAEDSEDTAAALTNAEESEALLETLERRREALQQRLDGA